METTKFSKFVVEERYLPRDPVCFPHFGQSATMVAVGLTAFTFWFLGAFESAQRVRAVG
jgi:hypothetical protein